MRHLSRIIPCALLIGVAVLAKADSTTFDQANRLYEDGRYLEAIKAYEQVLTNSPTTAAHFNLGNAWFKSGQMGEAVAQYRQAAALAPRDPDVKANLNFARAQVTGQSYRPGWFQRKAEVLTTGEWSTLATVSVWAFFGLLVAGQIRPTWRAGLKLWTIVLGAAAALLLAVSIWVGTSRADTRIAVVIQRETVMRRGPFDESQSALTLKSGAELRVLDAKNGWLQVTPDGRQSGWITNGAARIVPG